MYRSFRSRRARGFLPPHRFLECDDGYQRALYLVRKAVGAKVASQIYLTAETFIPTSTGPKQFVGIGTTYQDRSTKEFCRMLNELIQAGMLPVLNTGQYKDNDAFKEKVSVRRSNPSLPHGENTNLRAVFSTRASSSSLLPPPRSPLLWGRGHSLNSSADVAIERETAEKRKRELRKSLA